MGAPRRALTWLRVSPTELVESVALALRLGLGSPSCRVTLGGRGRLRPSRPTLTGSGCTGRSVRGVRPSRLAARARRLCIGTRPRQGQPRRPPKEPGSRVVAHRGRSPDSWLLSLGAVGSSQCSEKAVARLDLRYAKSHARPALQQRLFRLRQIGRPPRPQQLPRQHARFTSPRPFQLLRQEVRRER